MIDKLGGKNSGLGPVRNKTVSGLKNPQVISLLQQIRVRYRHKFLENAVMHYMDSKEGNRMFDSFRKNDREVGQGEENSALDGETTPRAKSAPEGGS